MTFLQKFSEHFLAGFDSVWSLIWSSCLCVVTEVSVTEVLSTGCKEIILGHQQGAELSTGGNEFQDGRFITWCSVANDLNILCGGFVLEAEGRASLFDCVLISTFYDVGQSAAKAHLYAKGAHGA